jgi:hypothetical protein
LTTAPETAEFTVSVTVQLPPAGIAPPVNGSAPLVVSGNVAVVVLPHVEVAAVTENAWAEFTLSEKSGAPGVLFTSATFAAGLLIVYVTVCGALTGTEMFGGAVTLALTELTCSVCEIELVAPAVVTTLLPRIVFEPFPAWLPNTLNENVHVPGVVDPVACGIVPPVSVTTDPAIDTTPPHVVGEPGRVGSSTALPPIVAMSSLTDVMPTDVVVSEFCSVTVTVEMPPTGTEIGLNTLFTVTAASADARHPRSMKSVAAVMRVKNVELFT